MDNSDGDALDDSWDPEPLYHAPDPLSYSNILSVEIKYIPLQEVKSFTGKIGRKLAKKWDCDVYVSILKSCDCDDDIFLLTNENKSLNEVFAISDELKKKLNNGEKEYSNSFGHVPNEEAAHTGKLETDQLVPEFFEKDSSYYYGCWYHNYCQEMAMYNDYVQQIGTNWSRVMQAIIIYNIATSALQNAVLSSANNTYTVSKADYANGAKAAKTQLSYSRVSKQAAEHSSLGEFTYNPKTGAVSRMKGGGHGQANIDFLEKNGFDYNIEKTYSNGVRVGNVPAHKIVAKRTGTNQSWFPETWTEQDIINAGEYVGNLSGNTNVADGVIVYGEYNGVRVGVIRTGGSISTVFPDSVRQP
ncbi:EndoU domain-containing protein [Ruminococcus flavefaciens]|uniref:EndoU nuclease-like protein n=1 Tax=Ruminococcus flavefaciens TaxID=1265 RepID=A0A315Y2I0_RUMFL|nr:EndoU domain-containing protein [Ruminococcus flavefaciens]PWJ14687.1 EndoU nuclease-like protein [Ruminococcus flavefaciens]SSA42717.1 EndoU nuclease [Ruminococcus flavefaciens]